jgi:hypothetical protein
MDVPVHWRGAADGRFEKRVELAFPRKGEWFVRAGEWPVRGWRRERQVLEPTYPALGVDIAAGAA